MVRFNPSLKSASIVPVCKKHSPFHVWVKPSNTAGIPITIAADNIIFRVQLWLAATVS